jgi:exonuclease VII large subunit
VSSGSPWWAPFSSPAEFHFHHQEQQQRQREAQLAHERWWASLSYQQRAEFLKQQADDEAAQRRRMEQQREDQLRTQRLAAKRLQVARASITASLEVLNSVGAPATVEVRDAYAELWPLRIGRGWLVGELSIWHAGSQPSGRSAGQDSSTSTFEVLVTTQGRWQLIWPTAMRRSRRRGRRYGEHLSAGNARPSSSLSAHERRVQDSFEAALPDYAAELQRLTRQLTNTTPG